MNDWKRRETCSLLIVSIIVCVALSQAGPEKSIELNEGKVTIDLPFANAEIEITILKHELDHVPQVDEVISISEGGLSDSDDSISVENDVVVYQEGESSQAANELPRNLSPELIEWIEVQTQSTSYFLSNLLTEIYLPKQDQGEAIAVHILFLNTYMELIQISRTRIPFIQWVDKKLVKLDEHVVASLRYLTKWVERSATVLKRLEKTKKGFSTNQDWVNIVKALHRIKKENNFSKDLDDKIDKILDDFVQFNSRHDWFNSALLGHAVPQDIIYYKANTEKIVPKSFPLSYQYSRIMFGF